jgi:hypothetical protein
MLGLIFRPKREDFENGENCDDKVTGRGMERERERDVHPTTNGGTTGFSRRTSVQVVVYLIMFPLYVTYAVDTASCTAIHRQCKWR